MAKNPEEHSYNPADENARSIRRPGYFFAVPLSEVHDSKLREALAHSGKEVEQAEQAREALYEVAAAHGVETDTDDTQLLPVDESGMPLDEAPQMPYEPEIPYEEIPEEPVIQAVQSVPPEIPHPQEPPAQTSSNIVTEVAKYRQSQPVPMTGMIPQVPNSHAAQRFGGVEPTASAPPVSVPTTTMPAGHGTGGRWGVRTTLRSFVRADGQAVAHVAPRGAARIAQRQFTPRAKLEERAQREALYREKEYARDTLNFTLRLAEAMFYYGADAMDVDSAIIAVSSAYGLDSVDVNITNQSVTINYTSDPDIYMESRISSRTMSADSRFTHTLVRVVRTSTENYEALASTYGLIHDITEGGMTLEDADLRLSEITNHPKPYPPLITWLANIGCATTLTAALGASWSTATAAAIVFIPVYLLIQWLNKIGMPTFFRMAASAGLLTFLAIWLGGDHSMIRRPGESISAPLVVAAGLIMFLPTSRLVGAVQDAINGFPVTAAGRFVSTGMSFLGLVIGIASAVNAISLFGGPILDIEQTRFDLPSPLTFSVFMLAATVTFAITLHTKLVKLGWLVLITCSALVTYNLYTYLVGVDSGRANTALAALVIGMLSTYVAYRLHAPQAVFSIPALTFLLPGLSFFRGMYLLTVETNVVWGIQSMISAVSIVIAMAAGVTLGNYLMQYLLQRFAVPRNVPAEAAE